MADAGSNPLGSGNPMNAGSQGGFQVNEGAANANIRGAMPRGGGNGGGIAGAIRDIADRKGRQADRERDNVDYAWRRGIDYEHSSNLSKLQSGLRITEIGKQGKQERKTARTVGDQTRQTAAQAGTIQANQTRHEANAQNYVAKKADNRARKATKLGAKIDTNARNQEAAIAETREQNSHKRGIAKTNSEARGVARALRNVEPGSTFAATVGGVALSGTAKKAPTAAAAQKAASKKPRTKPPTAK